MPSSASDLPHLCQPRRMGTRQSRTILFLQLSAAQGLELPQRLRSPAWRYRCPLVVGSKDGRTCYAVIFGLGKLECFEHKKAFRKEGS